MKVKNNDLRTLFDKINNKLGNKLKCEKIYIIPSMRYWVDEEENTVVISAITKGNEPYLIKKIAFNPDITKKEMKELLVSYMAQAMTLGDNWKTYIQYKNLTS